MLFTSPANSFIVFIPFFKNVKRTPRTVHQHPGELLSQSPCDWKLCQFDFYLYFLGRSWHPQTILSPWKAEGMALGSHLPVGHTPPARRDSLLDVKVVKP
jgi:hypothetical protein